MTATEGVRFENLTVEFGPTKALDSLDLALAPGQIVGLLGHNGAGKSTLVNVATGALSPTSGRIFIHGEQAPSRVSPSRFARLGVSVIHQEPALSANLTIEENLFLGQESSMKPDERKRVVQEALRRVGLRTDPRLPLSILDLGRRQLVNLARATVQGDVKALFLDEPTAALGGDDTRRLHHVIRRFADDGAAIAYVSHRLSDVFDVCDRIVVLREGRLVLDSPVEQTSLAEVTAALAPGVQLAAFAHARPGEVVVRMPQRGAEFRAGEVVGLYGMAGGDQFRLLDSAFGLRRGEQVVMKDVERDFRSPAEAIGSGVHMVPADRERDGILSALSGVANVFLPWLKRYARGLLPLSRRRLNAGYADARRALGILGPEGHAPIQAFSGGNRQKHVVARWIHPAKPEVLLLAQPTQGVDIGAKQDIVREVRELAAQGTCVILASAEADEIVLLADRAYVVDHGSCVPVERSPRFEKDLVNALIELVDTERWSA